MRTLPEINKVIENKNYPVLPFIDQMNKITRLKKGFYKKHKAEYRGVTCVKVKRGDKYYKEVRLVGYYYIPEDIVIVPKSIRMTEAKQTILDRCIERGFTVVPNLPSIGYYTYPEGSEEWYAAVENRQKLIDSQKAKHGRNL